LLNQFLTAEYCKAALRKSQTNWTGQTEIQVFIDLMNLDKDNFFSVLWIVSSTSKYCHLAIQAGLTNI
jgi:hypothetical protein